MEETNYDRRHPEQAPPPSRLEETPNAQPPLDRSNHPDGEDKPISAHDPEKKGAQQADGPVSTTTMMPSDSELGEVDWPRKSYLDKLSLKDKPRQNRLLDIALAPFKGFLYPPVVYAGLMYGANSLVWAGTQNATAGTVYTTIYGWNTAGVSGAYAGGVLGTILG